VGWGDARFFIRGRAGFLAWSSVRDPSVNRRGPPSVSSPVWSMSDRFHRCGSLCPAGSGTDPASTHAPRGHRGAVLPVPRVVPELVSNRLRPSAPRRYAPRREALRAVTVSSSSGSVRASAAQGLEASCDADSVISRIAASKDLWPVD